MIETSVSFTWSLIAAGFGGVYLGWQLARLARKR